MPTVRAGMVLTATPKYVGAGEMALRHFCAPRRATGFRCRGIGVFVQEPACHCRHGDAAFSNRSCKATNTCTWRAKPWPKSSTILRAWATNFAARYMISWSTGFNLLRLTGYRIGAISAVSPKWPKRRRKL